MKKLSTKQRLRLLRLNRHHKKCVMQERRKRLSEKQQYMRFGACTTLVAPERFNLEGDVLSLLAFTNKLERAAANKHLNRIRLDFSSTEKMFSDGTLYFLAILDSLRARFPRKRFTLRPPSDPIVGQVLQQVGINDLLKLKNLFPTEALHKTVRHWCVASGNIVDAQKADNIFTNIKGKLTDELTRSVYTGVTEAMTNCHHHAYEGMDLPDAQLKKWWMFSREDASSLQVLFCDLGIGIPHSLYREGETIDSSWFDTLTNWMRNQRKNGKIINDALKIKAAIEIGRSRTKMGNRGKGLQQMVQILDEISNGNALVRIISGKGVYRRRPKGKSSVETPLPLSNDKKAAIKGTMICWSIPLTREGKQK